MEKKYKVKLNSIEKIEELLQEIYDQAVRHLNEIQMEMNKLQNSTNLGQDGNSIEDKAKYAKAMNDFITNKDKAIGRKLDIAKLMSEILKFNGNVKLAVTEGELPDWQEITNALVDNGDTTNEENVEKYHLK